MISHIRRLSHSAFYLVVANGIFMVSGYGVHFFLGRYLGPAEYGIYGVVISLMSSVNQILTAGLPTALSEQISLAPSRHDAIWRSAFKLQTVLSFTVAVTYLLAAGWLGQLFGDKSLTGFFALSALIFPTYSIYALLYGYNNGLKKFKVQALLLSVYSFGKLAVTVLLAILVGVYGAIVGFVVAPLLAIVVAGLPGKKDSEVLTPKIRFDSRKLIRFAFPFTVSSVAGGLIAAVDLSMIKILLGDNTLVGVYLAASTLARAPQNVYTAITAVAFPLIAGGRKGADRIFLKKTIGASVIMLSGLVLIATLVVSVLASFLVRIFYSELYIAAAPLLVILAIGSAFYSIADLFSTVTNGLGKPKIPALVTFLALPVDIGLNYFLIPRYGTNGAAFATTITSFILMLASISCGIMVYRKAIK
jgi:stage V sporulation protein B